MDQEKRKAYSERIGRCGHELWRTVMEIQKTTDPADPDDTAIRHAAEILSSVSYVVDECCEMINPTK